MKTLEWEDVLHLLEHGDPENDDPVGKVFKRARIGAVVHALQHTDNNEIKHQLLRILGGRKPKRYAMVVIPYLNDPSAILRFDAADTLAKIGVASAGSALMRRFYQETDKWVKFRIAEALGAVGYQAAIPQLIESLRDHDEMLRAGAAWALGRLNATEALPVLRSMLESESDMYTQTNMIVTISGLTGGPKTLDEFYANELEG